MKLANLICIFITVCFTCAPLSHASDAEKGLEIAKEIKNRDLGWTDTIANTQMILRAPDGRESVRELRVKTLEVENDGDKA